jgi:hypothetical protein
VETINNSWSGGGGGWGGGWEKGIAVPMRFKSFNFTADKVHFLLKVPTFEKDLLNREGDVKGFNQC